MELELVRKFYGKTFTEGKIFINNGFECYSVEDKDRKLETAGCSAKVQDLTAIPKGRYKIDITYSKRFKRDLIILLGVPCFTGIRIHSGNKAEDSEGCIIVGSDNKRDDDNWVGLSRIAYEKLHDKVQKALDDGEEVWINVR